MGTRSRIRKTLRPRIRKKLRPRIRIVQLSRATAAQAAGSTVDTRCSTFYFRRSLWSCCLQEGSLVARPQSLVASKSKMLYTTLQSPIRQHLRVRSLRGVDAFEHFLISIPQKNTFRYFSLLLFASTAWRAAAQLTAVHSAQVAAQAAHSVTVDCKAG